MVFRTLIAALVLAATMPAPAAANEFHVIRDKDSFVQLVTGRELRRFGIRLQVTPDGGIDGRGFGHAVTGEWRWDGGYFCRVMAYGTNEIAHNCQLVAVQGDRVRFVADRGRGEYADFNLR
jgi:hypothetical protein